MPMGVYDRSTSRPRKRRLRLIRIEGLVAYVPLTQSKEAIIDAEYADLIGQWAWHYCAGYARTNISREKGAKRSSLLMHHLIKKPPKGFEIDHCDLNRLNNLQTNLRIATRSQNAFNKTALKNNHTRLKGVSPRNRVGTFRARIKTNGKSKYLGDYATPELAHAAYCHAAARLHGEFARTQ